MTQPQIIAAIVGIGAIIIALSAPGFWSVLLWGLAGGYLIGNICAMFAVRQEFRDMLDRVIRENEREKK